MQDIPFAASGTLSSLLLLKVGKPYNDVSFSEKTNHVAHPKTQNPGWAICVMTIVWAFYVQGRGQRELSLFYVEFQWFRPGLQASLISPSHPWVKNEFNMNREKSRKLMDHSRTSESLNMGPLFCSARKQTGFHCTSWNQVPVIRETRLLVQNTCLYVNNFTTYQRPKDF